jgi:hypothetical protein
MLLFSFNHLFMKYQRIVRKEIEAKMKEAAMSVKLSLIIPASIAFTLALSCNDKSAFNGGHAAKNGDTPAVPEAPAIQAPPQTAGDPSPSVSEGIPESERTAAEPAAPEAAAPEATAPAMTVGPTEPLIAPPPSQPEIDAAVNDCIRTWGSHPFSEEQMRNPTLLKVSDSAQLNNTTIFSHRQESDNFQLYVVNFDIRIGNSGTMELLDPMGWYCIYVTAKVANNFTVNHQCQNQVALVSSSAQNAHNFQIVPIGCP